MAATTANELSDVSFFGNLFRFDLYKRNQGKLIRQTTGGVIAAWVLFGSWSLFGALRGTELVTQYTVSFVVLVLGLQFAFRMVHFPGFADFLIASEAELKKVSWPSRGELIRGTIVVLVVMFLLAVILFCYDIVWRTVFTGLGVLESGATETGG